LEDDQGGAGKFSSVNEPHIEIHDSEQQLDSRQHEEWREG
jgi:hypothetical protein